MKTIQVMFVVALTLLAALLVEAAPVKQNHIITMELQLPAAEPVRSAWSIKEIDCLTAMVYSEAGGESYAGKVAVAATAVTRSLRAGWPNDLCAVIKAQNQFTYLYELRADNAIERAAFEEASRAATHATLGYGTLPASYRESLFFHSGQNPYFARLGPVQGRIGNHTFYGLHT